MRLFDTIKNQVDLIDPSELLRPEFAAKDLSTFRDYSIDENDPIKEQVRRTYRQMHLNQTVEFVQKKRDKWLQFNHFTATIREALEKLNDLVDESDPDISLPNIMHAFQAAEQARLEYPELDWLHLTALIHDLGKVMAFFDEPQWAVVGDTFPVGCLWSENIVYRDTSFKDNIDENNPKYNTKYGMYKPNCGIDNLLMSWGHDEYLFEVLKHNKCTLPSQALNIIRFHSFYPWHSARDYTHLEQSKDLDTLKWVNIFNRYDLYTKNETVPDIENLWPYYQTLIDKYCPGELHF